MVLIGHEPGSKRAKLVTLDRARNHRSLPRRAYEYKGRSVSPCDLLVLVGSDSEIFIFFIKIATLTPLIGVCANRRLLKCNPLCGCSRHNIG
jgi:hypothetical protein